MGFEFPAVSQTRIEWWGSPQFTRKGMLLFTIFLGMFGFHHFYLRSPQTGILFLIFNTLSLGFWYFFDIIQLSTKTSEELNTYGLDLPWYGATGIAQGMWKCAENGSQPQPQQGGVFTPSLQEGGATTAAEEPPNPLWALLYMVTLPLLPLSRFLVGDPYNSLISVLNLTIIPFGWIMNIISAAVDFFYVVLFPGEIFYNGIKRPFPFTMLGWSKDGFSKRLTGHEKSLSDCEDDSFVVRIGKGLVRTSLPLLDKVLPIPLTAAIQAALTTKQQVVDRALEVADTGMKISTQVGTLATAIPTGVARGIAAAQTNIDAAIRDPKLAAFENQHGGGITDVSVTDSLSLVAFAALIGGAFLLNVGRSFTDAVHAVRGPSDVPPPVNPRS